MGIGTQLRRARETMGLTLEDVQQRTKIHAEYLRALENDMFDSLPSPFYVRAFLRTYAKSLGLDPQPLLNRYERLNQGGAGPAVEFRRTRPVPAGASRGTTGRFRTNPRLSGTGSNPRVAPSSTRPSQHTGRFQTGRMAVTGRERAVGEKMRPPVSSTSRSSAVPQHTGRFRTASFPVAGAEGQAFPTHTLPPRRESPAPSAESKGKKRDGWLLSAAVVGTLLVGSAAWYYLAQGNSPSGGSPDTVQEPGDDTGNGTVSAQQQNAPQLVLKEVNSGFLGDLYQLSNADQIVVQIKATKGESVLTYGEKSDAPEETYTLRLGDVRTIKKDRFLWFRLTVPSNVQIQVNGKAEIDTTAQDVAKSYRIQLKK